MYVEQYKVKEGFWNALATDNVKEAQAKISRLILLQIEEEGFTRKILPSTPVTAADCQRALDNDEFVFIVDFPPESGAGVFTFFGEGRYKVVEGKRAAVPFVTISTDWQQWQKRQFLAYPYNVEQYLRQSFAIRLQTTEDWYFLTLCEAALALNPNNIVKGTVITETGAATSAFQKDDLVLLLKVLTKKMVGKTILITQKNIAEMGAWQRADLDDRTMESTGAQGPDAFVSKNYFGLNWIRTIKEDLLQPGNIYLFGPSQMLGVFLTFGGVDFMIERHGNYIKMAADEAIAMCVANYNALAKLELYSGSSAALPSWEDIHKQPATTAVPVVSSL